MLAITWAWHEAPREAVINASVGASVTAAIAGVTYALHRARERAAALRHKAAMAHARHQTMLAEETHHYVHTGKPHPRAQSRIDLGGHATPELAR